jgi:hypothetical protein
MGSPPPSALCASHIILLNPPYGAYRCASDLLRVDSTRPAIASAQSPILAPRVCQLRHRTSTLRLLASRVACPTRPGPHRPPLPAPTASAPCVGIVRRSSAGGTGGKGPAGSARAPAASSRRRRPALPPAKGSAHNADARRGEGRSGQWLAGRWRARGLACGTFVCAIPRRRPAVPPAEGSAHSDHATRHVCCFCLQIDQLFVREFVPNYILSRLMYELITNIYHLSGKYLWTVGQSARQGQFNTESFIFSISHRISMTFVVTSIVLGLTRCASWEIITGENLHHLQLGRFI